MNKKTTTEKKTTPKKRKVDFLNFTSRLETMILTGGFKARERLTEASLSEMFGVNRYMVRDAFKVLSTKGLVKVTPFKGAVVSELSKQELEELFVIRSVLEQRAVSLAAEHATAEDIKILRSIVKKIEDAHRDDDFVAMVTTDTKFHDTIFRISRNNSLRRMINDLRDRCYIVRYLAWSWPNIRQQITNEHRLIVDAIEAHNLAKLNTLVEKHLYHAWDSYLLRLKAENAILK